MEWQTRLFLKNTLKLIFQFECSKFVTVILQFDVLEPRINSNQYFPSYLMHEFLINLKRNGDITSNKLSINWLFVWKMENLNGGFDVEFTLN